MWPLKPLSGWYGKAKDLQCFHKRTPEEHTRSSSHIVVLDAEHRNQKSGRIPSAYRIASNVLLHSSSLHSYHPISRAPHSCSRAMIRPKWVFQLLNLLHGSSQALSIPDQVSRYVTIECLVRRDVLPDCEGRLHACHFTDCSPYSLSLLWQGKEHVNSGAPAIWINSHEGYKIRIEENTSRGERRNNVYTQQHSCC